MATKKRKNFTLSDETMMEETVDKKELVKRRKDFIKKYKKSGKPIWSDEDHPDLITLEDIANYRPLTWRMDSN